jgi:hypothetical protein
MSALPSPRRQLFEVVTVGLPFSTFKLVVGSHLIATTPLGWPLLVLGVVDLVMNVGNAVGLVVRGRPFLPLCLLHGLARRLGPSSSSSSSPPTSSVPERHGELGLAVDMALAFVLVAGMIAAGQIGQLSPTALSWWNGAVILNVLGAGALRLVDAARAAARP